MTVDRLAHGIAALLGHAVSEVQPIVTESRNAIARVTLVADDGPYSAILKTYEAAGDPHWANRFRREEKVLTLLANARPPVAPRPIAGFAPAGGPAALLMEDAGTCSLADALMADGSSGRWTEAARFLSDLHAAMGHARLPLKRTAQAISLDRINGPILMQRMRIAGARVLGKTPEYAVQREMRALIAPLLATPKTVIHNSMSPLNVVIGPDGWRAIDWETLSVAPTIWDWAELLRAPYNPLPFDESEGLMLEAAGLDAESARGLFRRAVLSRHLDSLATVIRRQRYHETEGRPDRAAEYARRAAFYARDLQHMAARLEIPARLSGWLRAMWESAL